MVEGPKDVELAGDERATVLAYADPIAANALEGFNAGDHAQLARNFNEVMKNQFTPAVFEQTRQLILGKVGRYRSGEAAMVLKRGPYRMVQYAVEFERESGVTVTFSFLDYQGALLLAGLWFDSPKLRE